MRVVWVTGMPGTGKSTACRALAGRLPVQDGDEDGFSFRRSLVDGARVADTVPKDWSVQEWVLDVGRVAGFAARPEPVGLLLGAVANEAEAEHLFERVVLLHAPADVLVERLRDRTTNDFGKDPAELALVLRVAERSRVEHVAAGATVVDATEPVDVVARRLLEVAAEVAAGVTAQVPTTVSRP